MGKYNSNKTSLVSTKSNLNWFYFMCLILIAYSFSVGVRSYWVNHFSNTENFKWNNELMINTTDGYFFAEGARDILKGITKSDHSPIENPLSQITAFFVEYLPFSFEAIILWMSAFLASLVVIPLMLMGRCLRLDYMGFVAALIGGISWSYYSRTMAGYYDTDMLTIVFACFILYSLVLNILQKRNRYLLLIPFFIISSIWFYPQSYSLIMGFVIITLLYTLIFELKNSFNYKVLIFMLISMASILLWIKIVLGLVLFLAFHFKKDIFSLKIVLGILLVVSLIVLFTGGFNPIIGQLNKYLFRIAAAADIFDTIKLEYFSVIKTVAEAGNIQLNSFMQRVSGHWITFIFSMIGYVLLCFRYKVMLLALPMVGLGFFALSAGLRFTIYVVPIASVGIAYFIFFIASYFKSTLLRFLFICISTSAVLYPHLGHVRDYLMPTVFNKQEVAILDKFKNIASRDDYVLSWWDYGYPLRYYSDVKTLGDGGLNIGMSNYPLSYVLTNEQIRAANMARLYLEYRKSMKTYHKNLVQILRDYNTTDIDLFLEQLEMDDFKLPKKTIDLYLFLPSRMMRIFPVIEYFSNLELKTGNRYKNSFFYRSNSFSEKKDIIILGNGVKVYKKKGTIQIGNNEQSLNHFVTTSYDNRGKLNVKTIGIDPNANLSVVFMKNYNQFLVLDKKLYNSVYIQLFVLEKYNKKLFEPVILNPYAKIYKLKI